MATRIRAMTIKERLHKLVDELSEAEADEALLILSRSCQHDGERAVVRREREIDQAIIESYTRIPQEELGASWAVRQSIREEPWDRKSPS
jgi:hypothetical protein